MHKTYQHIFFDLDHTIWDFESNSKLSMKAVYEQLGLYEKGILDFELFFKTYMHYNDLLWERYRSGFIKQEELRWKRMFKTLLDFKIGSEVLSKEMSVLFLDLLPTRNALFPNTIEILAYLKKKQYQLHLITNGFEEVQKQKLIHANIDHYFDKLITSEASNSLKPHKEIFEYAFNATNATLENAIMIGDNIDADITGAKNVGLDTIWVNHLSTEKSPIALYTVHNLLEIQSIL